MRWIDVSMCLITFWAAMFMSRTWKSIKFKTKRVTELKRSKDKKTDIFLSCLSSREHAVPFFSYGLTSAMLGIALVKWSSKKERELGRVEKTASNLPGIALVWSYEKRLQAVILLTHDDKNPKDLLILMTSRANRSSSPLWGQNGQSG